MAPPRDVTRVANTVEGQPALQMGARVGYAVSGVLHLLIAWIALQVAWIASGKSADQSGALQTLAGSSLGRLALWVAVLGFLALGLWQLASALAVRTGGESSKWAIKAKGIAKAVVYLVLAWTSFSFAKGQPSSSKAQSADFTATLLQHTADGVADPCADLQGGMALNLGCDTRDISSLRHRSLLSKCRRYSRGSMFLARSGSEVRILRSHG